MKLENFGTNVFSVFQSLISHLYFYLEVSHRNSEISLPQTESQKLEFLTTKSKWKSLERPLISLLKTLIPGGDDAAHRGQEGSEQRGPAGSPSAYYCYCRALAQSYLYAPAPASKHLIIKMYHFLWAFP